MYVDFKELPDNSRIWIYISERALTDKEISWLGSATESFLEKWTAHGNALQSSYTVLYKHILVIGLNEGVADASGCSIDASVHFVKGLGAELRTDFFNRNLIPFYNNGEVEIGSLEKLKERLTEGEISGESTIFNTLIAQKADLGNSIISLRNSWLSRYLKIQDPAT